MGSDLDKLIEEAKVRFAAMTPAERAEMHRVQAESFARSLKPCKHGMVDWEDCTACRHEAMGIRK